MILAMGGRFLAKKWSKNGQKMARFGPSKSGHFRPKNGPAKMHFFHHSHRVSGISTPFWGGRYLEEAGERGVLWRPIFRRFSSIFLNSFPQPLLGGNLKKSRKKRVVFFFKATTLSLNRFWVTFFFFFDFLAKNGLKNRLETARQRDPVFSSKNTFFSKNR